MNTNTQTKKKNHTHTRTIEGGTEGWEGRTAAFGLQRRESKEQGGFRHKPKNTI